MIIFRYLAREVLVSMLAVSSVLLLIIMSGRFVKFLGQAASGRIGPDVLLAVMGYRIPGFLELVLPLGLFIAILLAYGRLCMDSEMTVLSACGMSQKRVLGYTMAPALLVAAIVALLSLQLSPMGAQRSDLLLEIQKQRSEFDQLKPARFQEMQGGDSVTYSESLSLDRTQLNEVFVAEMATSDDETDTLAVIFARSGEQITDPVNGEKYLILRDGYRYAGRPGEADYQEIAFESYAQHLQPIGRFNPNDIEADAMPTAALWGSDNLQRQATLQWRLSLPLLVLVVTLLAVPLSKTNPRQGRYVQMIPAILIYIVYLVALNAARGAIEDGKLPAASGIWLVHLVFVALAVFLNYREGLTLKWRQFRSQAHA